MQDELQNSKKRTEELLGQYKIIAADCVRNCLIFIITEEVRMLGTAKRELLEQFQELKG